jgi:hypothetical protein
MGPMLSISVGVIRGGNEKEWEKWVKLLVRYGAKQHIRDTPLMYPLEIAVDKLYNYLNIATILAQGADISNKNNKSPLKVLFKSDILKMIVERLSQE